MLKRGDSAQDGDTWFRYATAKSHLNKSGTRIHHALFRGARAITPPTEQAAGRWKSEISGRLRSLAGSADEIREEGKRRVQSLTEKAENDGRDSKIFAFRGIVFAPVDKLREYPLAKADVIYDPVEHPIIDNAHANLVFYDKEPEDFDMQPLTLINALIECLELARPDEI